ncbi:(2Fe-2S)-binding protein [Candidatus Fermentibacteria bacterium]|nr:(2Fe-2S)-binding protein [Candidatus Fermentibacteria bacterium]
MPLECTVNGQSVNLRVLPTARLLDVLRSDLGLTGCKEGCGEGECGACAVLLDGRVVDSCLVLALEAQGGRIVTIEGLADKGLHPIQQAFIEEGAVQCGFCTPGFIMSTYALLQEDPSPTDDEIVRALEGNLCRCTGYLSILRAVRRAARLMEETP